MPLVKRATKGSALTHAEMDANLDYLQGLVTVNAINFSTEVAIAGAVALDAAAFGKNHVCSGTSVDYSVTLPSPVGHAGKVIGFRMSGALTKLVTLNAGLGVAIDGQQTRVMWAAETAWLLCDGANWFKVAGASRPMMARMRYTDNTGFTVSAITETVVQMSEVQFDDGSLCDLANHRIIVRRAGRYVISGYFFHATAGATTAREVGYLYVNSVVAIMAEQYLGNTNNDGHIALSTPIALASADVVNLRVYSSQGGKKVRASVASGIYPYLAIKEELTW